MAALAVALAWWIVLATPSAHAVCLTDVQGADDEPGQKDLSQLCLLGTCVGGASESLSFDDTAWSGNNTGDACYLFDTDGDGKANRVVCVTIENDPAQLLSGSPRCYTCGDTRADRCTSSVSVACTSTCSLSFTTDPFQFDPNHIGNKCHGTDCRTQDATATCCLTATDAGAGGVLIDVCSYPSQEPNSDPSDCVVNAACHTAGDCDDQNPCTVDSCDPSFGVCVHVAGNAGAQCRAASGVCDVAEYCDGSSIYCPADGFAQGGLCRNANGVCDVAEYCDGTGPDCPPDGFQQGGVCRSATGQCDVAESCSGTSADCPPDAFEPNSTPCDDGSNCTTNDVCTNGNCVGGPPPSCNDNNPCTDDGCNPATGCTHVNNNDPCNDGNACTTNDACAGGSCVGGPLLDCNDNDICTDDTCNTATGCVHTNNSAPCDDGDACTGPDHCSNDNCTGASISCNDGNVCTTDSCDTAIGCTHTGVPGCCNVDAECADTDQCTTNEHCDNHTCVSDSVNCNDNNSCTDDGCNPASGCTHVDNNDPCNDGNACTTDDACAGGSCVGGPLLDCNDNDVCTDDTCDTATGCVHTDNSAPCDDGNACTTGDTCSNDSCHGAFISCDDGDPCTDDDCNPSTGCTHAFNSAPCEDGNACTLNDVCSGGVCTAGTPKDCNDFDLCTDDSCNTSTGACEHVNNFAPCDDGDYCTDGDHCFNDSCIGAFPHDCGDGNECTTDTCSSTLGCQHAGIPGCCNPGDPNPCADTDACTTNEHCENHVCVSDPVICDDGDPCTVDICDSFGGFGCTHTPCPQVPNAPCPPDCIPEACGNHVIDPGETCDPPDPTPIPGTNPAQPKCRPDCTFCGDGVVDNGQNAAPNDGEQCDDGTTAVGCNHKGFPNDPTQPPAGPCQNTCAPPICKDPTVIKMGQSIDKYTFHGRLALITPVDFTGQSLEVELVSAAGKPIYRASVLEGNVASTSGTPAGPWTYRNAAAAVSGGVAKIKIRNRNGFSRATVLGFGNLLAAQSGMVAHFHSGSSEWEVTGDWRQLKTNLWKLFPPSQ